ncbi:MAG: DNA-binding HxlR family transcriptional regulator [Paracoccaceae bacterium]|jgi:DNA-binding HxlR family transcriptional regulator
MKRADLSAQTCTIARAVALVGDEWSIMILREMFLGARRYDDILRQTGMSPHILATRLRKLVAMGVLRREAYCDHPPRHDYRLTAMGRDLWPAVVALKQWGDRWLGSGDAPVEIVHRACGHAVTPTLTCPDCGAPMTAHDAVPRLSPDYAIERETRRKSP